jgi:hypothetical protein
MEDVAYWRDQAAKFRQDAERTKDASLEREYRELALVCEQVAGEMEDRLTAG